MTTPPLLTVDARGSTRRGHPSSRRNARLLRARDAGVQAPATGLADLFAERLPRLDPGPLVQTARQRTPNLRAFRERCVRNLRDYSDSRGSMRAPTRRRRAAPAG